MVGILIATHGEFANGLKDAMELIIGKQENLMAIGLHHWDGVEEFEGWVNDALDKLDTGDGVIAFVDILGGTPSNTMFKCLANRKFKAIAGVNLPMLIVAVSMREGVTEDELFSYILDEANQTPAILHEMYASMVSGDADDEEDEI